ncbi:MAG: ImmA/IrrE family metallo-endopeptidase [Acidobacteria bacterium]|nr:ImmA/IrrE family metallo-endopeptidase [Acidobacteriota bacterium]
MSERVFAIVKPELLVWARESAGLQLDVAAKKAHLKPEKLDLCEQGKERLTINQLRAIAKVYKRPLAVFYLSRPPKKFDALRDFRRLLADGEINESPQLKLEVRRAIYRRKVALEMHQELGSHLPKLELKLNRENDPEMTAVRVREFLRIRLDEQKGFKTDYDALGRWRSAIESKGILVFQTSKVAINEMRGFSISEEVLPVIVVNSKDAPYARIFSMLHELTHLLLKESSLCDLKERNSLYESTQIEAFCNRIAGAVLVPKNSLLNEQLVKKNRHSIELPDEIVSSLAKGYHVSREVILRRLLITNLISEDFYRKKRAALQKEHERHLEATATSERAGFAPPDVKAVSEAGRSFVQLVLNSYYQEKITLSDVSDFLEVRLKHLPKIEKAVQNKFTEAGALV